MTKSSSCHPLLWAICYVLVIGSMLTGAQSSPRLQDPFASTSATVEGFVLTEEQVPLSGVVVTVSAPLDGISRGAVTDANGRFELRMPAVGVIVIAGKRGYFQELEASATLHLRAGGLHQVIVRMQRAGAIEGVLTDLRGNAISGLLIFAIDAHDSGSVVQASFRGARTTPMAVTDSRGAYRISDLRPGEYVVVAISDKGVATALIEAPGTDDVEAMLAWLAHGGAGRDRGSSEPVPWPKPKPPEPKSIVPVFFPGTPVRAHAGRIALAPGEEANASFAFSPVRLVTIDGFVANGPASNVKRLTLSVDALETIGAFALSNGSPALSYGPDADGRFQFGGVVPGRYRIHARAESPQPGASVPVLYGVANVDVGNERLQDVVLRLEPGAAVSGLVLLDSLPGSVRLDRGHVQLAVVPAMDRPSGSIGKTQIGNPFAIKRSAVAEADGTFHVEGIAPGTYRLQCTITGASASQWWPMSVLVNGRDALDRPFELVTDEISVMVTVTNRPAELYGTLLLSNGSPAAGFDVVLFPRDPGERFRNSRRISRVRPKGDGSFVFSKLAAGEYLVAALTAAANEDWQVPESLASIASFAVPIKIVHGERVRQDLRVLGHRHEQR